MSDDFHIRRASPDDAVDRETIVELVSEMFGADISDRYDWLYRDNPHGHALTWLAVDADDRAVALTSLFPRRVSVGGRERTGSIGGDCYVVPAARRRGLATRLHQASLREMAAGGVEFMYGPPRPNNFHALLKAGSAEVGVYQRFSRPLTGEAAASAVAAALGRTAPRALGALADLPLRLFYQAGRVSTDAYDVAPVDEFDAEWDTLWKRAAAPAAICPVRDAAFLRWHYSLGERVPLAVRRGGELVGLVVYEAQQADAVICDLFAVDRAAADVAFQAAIDRAQSERRARIDYLVTPAGVDRWQLRRHGFFGRDTRGFQVAVPEAEPGDSKKLLCDPASWYFTEGDKDMWSCFSEEPE